MNKPIRVGLIRCDTHGAYYATLMARHDPLKLQRPAVTNAEALETWMTGGVHFYHYQHYSDPTRMTVEMVDGFEIVKVWDHRTTPAQVMSEILDSHPQVCHSYEQVSDDVDLVFIADCDGDGSDHLELATPGLQKGVPTYIDKPLAFDLADAKKILALASKNNVPVFSASILRHLPGALQFRSRLAEIGKINSGCVRGDGNFMAGQIHTISLAIAVFGNGIQEVRAMGPGDLGVVHLSWGDRIDRPTAGVVVHQNIRESWHCSNHVSAYGPEGAILSHHNLNDWYYPSGATNILKLIKQMVITSAVDDSMADMIEAVAVVNAARMSAKEGSRGVQLREI